MLLYYYSIDTEQLIAQGNNLLYVIFKRAAEKIKFIIDQKCTIDSRSVVAPIEVS